MPQLFTIQTVTKFDGLMCLSGPNNGEFKCSFNALFQSHGDVQ